MTYVCGTGGWTGPLPGDPDNTITLNATSEYGGIRVGWSYPGLNPHAVAYFKVYRAASGTFGSAIEIATVSNNYHFDPFEEETTRFYWVAITSVNGTEGQPIGPVSATSKRNIQKILEDLAGQIDAGVLAQSLKEKIDDITLNYDELTDEIANRIAGNAALAAALADVQNGVTDALAFVDQEITIRENGYSALALQIDTIAAVNATNAAAILAEQIARVDGDDAIAINASAALAAAEDAAAIVDNIETAKIGYSAISGTTTPYDGDGSTVVYTVGMYPTVGYPEYAADRTRIIDKTGVTNWNATAAGIAKPLIWVSGLPLATAVKTVQVTGPGGEIASVQTAFTAQKTLNDGLKAAYTAKVDVNGLVGGFGIYNDGVVVEAGFDVDKFWVGRTNNKVKPFIIEGGVVYIDSAIIKTLTADKIDTRGLTIKDANGNIVFSAGVPLDWASNLINNKPTSLSALNSSEGSKLSGIAAGATNVTNTNQLTDGANLGGTASWSSVSGRPANISGLNGSEPILNSAITLSGLGAGTFASLSNLNSSNIGSYVAANAIDGTYISSLVASKITAGQLAVGVVYAGNITASQITSGSLSADRISGGTITGVNVNLGSGALQYSGNNILIQTGTFSRCIAENGTAPGLPAFTATSSGSGAAISVNGGSGYGLAITGGSAGIVQTGGGANYVFAWLPNADNTHQLGGSGFKWSQIYATTATINTSDVRTKTQITNSPLGLSFINDLRPVSYLQVNAENIATYEEVEPTEEDPAPSPIQTLTPRPGVRPHYGLIAQEVKAALDTAGQGNAAIWVTDDINDPDSKQGLRYEELIAPMIKAIQELSAEVETLKAQINP